MILKKGEKMINRFDSSKLLTVCNEWDKYFEPDENEKLCFKCEKEKEKEKK